MDIPTDVIFDDVIVHDRRARIRIERALFLIETVTAIKIAGRPRRLGHNEKRRICVGRIHFFIPWSTSERAAPNQSEP